MSPEFQKKNCEKCEFVDKLAADNWFRFLGCRHKPYRGKWITEIEVCPKKAESVQHGKILKYVEYHGGLEMELLQCSVCFGDLGSNTKDVIKYCPHCGAKMDGDNNAE